MNATRVSCPHCARGCTVPTNTPTKNARCPFCRKTFSVPDLFDLLPPAPPPEEPTGPAVPLRPATVARPPKQKKRRPQPLEKIKTKKPAGGVCPPETNGGCAPLALELVFPWLTAGFLGGCGPLAAGKGSNSVCVSILGCLVGWYLTFAVSGWFFAPFAVFLLTKWICDLINSAG